MDVKTRRATLASALAAASFLLGGVAFAGGFPAAPPGAPTMAHAKSGGGTRGSTVELHATLTILPSCSASMRGVKCSSGGAPSAFSVSRERFSAAEEVAAAAIGVAPRITEQASLETMYAPSAPIEQSDGSTVTALPAYVERSKPSADGVMRVTLYF